MARDRKKMKKTKEVKKVDVAGKKKKEEEKRDAIVIKAWKK